MGKYSNYYPFGGIMDGRSYQSGSDGRYKFSSKERDAETELGYFDKRYFDSRLGRWLGINHESLVLLLVYSLSCGEYLR